METMPRYAAAPPTGNRTVYSITPVENAAPARAATTRRKTSLLERARTVFDRTLDAAFGRFSL